jgi:hypothetical protein
MTKKIESNVWKLQYYLTIDKIDKNASQFR